MKAFRIRIELIGSSPLVWRHVLIPAGATFHQLFDTIQLAMGWRGDSTRPHGLYEFVLPAENTRITNDGDALDEFAGLDATGQSVDLPASAAQRPAAAARRISRRFPTVLEPTQTPMGEFLVRHGQLVYTYDLLGSQWQHRLVLDETIDDYDLDCPILLDAEGDCPPEDAQGFAGYAAFLKALRNPAHPGHAAAQAFAWEQMFSPFDRHRQNACLSTIRILAAETPSRA